MAQQLDCPVDFIQVNEYRIRLTALQVLFIGIIFLCTNLWILPAFLIIDFLLRAAKLGKYSLLNSISGLLVKVFNISNKPVDQAPKRFAASIGCVFSSLILVSALLKFDIASIALTAVLILFAALESLVSFCAGCYVYTYYRRIFRK